MNQLFRVVPATLVLIGVAAVAAGQTLPIQREQIPCSGYALDVNPPPPAGRTARFCYSFEAQAGQQIESACSALVYPLGGPPVGVACEVLIGDLNGNAFSAQAVATNGEMAVLDYTIPQTGPFLVETIYFGLFGFFNSLNFWLNFVSPPPCVADATSLCVAGSRFRITADWRTEDGNSGHASAVSMTPDTGYFWFFDPSNVEVVAKVLNGCSVNNHYWFFGSGLTNVGVQITVKDTLSGAIQHYSNSLGTPFAPIQDTTAFATCP